MDIGDFHSHSGLYWRRQDGGSVELFSRAEDGGDKQPIATFDPNAWASVVAHVGKPSDLENDNARLRELLGYWRSLVQENSVPRYTVLPGAALNNLVDWTDDALTGWTDGDGTEPTQ